MNALTRISRRRFLAVADAAGALILGVRIAEPSCGPRLLDAASTAQLSPNIWLSIAATGDTTIWVAKAEMGQGVYTAFPMLVADELDAEWSSVRVLQAIVEPRFAEFIGTGGSSSIRTSWEPLRRAGAAAREMLITAAAARWDVSVAQCHTEPGVAISAHRETCPATGYAGEGERFRGLWH
jgi:isoquinoline 1-oxidoreductase beta subunit